jgi:hypothetical protein
MALFRSRTTKPVAVAEAPVAEPAQTAKAASAKKTETTAPHGAAKNGTNILQELGIYTLPAELKADFRKLREEVQRFLVEENYVAATMGITPLSGGG